MSSGEPDKISGLEGWSFLVARVVGFLVFGSCMLEFLFRLVMDSSELSGEVFGGGVYCSRAGGGYCHKPTPLCDVAQQCIM